ncbi:hypothetical protein BVG19_g4450 [[Candida] boidinii]|nr:hypothetical protein BVG19_g4450 [[Candida] boidinii]OWB49339.1 hypothetical protein B5S27_g879 [[Candida] boidinii]
MFAAANGYYMCNQFSITQQQQLHVSQQLNKIVPIVGGNVPVPGMHSRNGSLNVNAFENPYEITQQQIQNECYIQQQQQQAQIQVQQQAIQQVAEPAQQQETVVGGVTAILEYDIEQMTKFVCWLCYGLMKRTDNPTSVFHSTVKQVLSATRLPKSTIILSLLYLSDKMENEVEPTLDDTVAFQNVMISFVLANKFNDDNTFRNQSWSDATGLRVDLINKLEREWLCNIKWRLHYEDGYECIEECWKTWSQKFNSPIATPILQQGAQQQQQQQQVTPVIIAPQVQPSQLIQQYQNYPLSSAINASTTGSPASSLFSEGSSYSPGVISLNSSPWMGDYSNGFNYQQQVQQQVQQQPNVYVQEQYQHPVLQQQVHQQQQFYDSYVNKHKQYKSISSLNSHPVEDYYSVAYSQLNASVKSQQSQYSIYHSEQQQQQPHQEQQMYQQRQVSHQNMYPQQQQQYSDYNLNNHHSIPNMMTGGYNSYNSQPDNYYQFYNPMYCGLTLAC